MYSRFLILEQEKRDRIINAAIMEFAKKGYEDASTNEIVKSAGISKGLLFHYFKNKKSLFLFMYDYSIEVLSKELYSKMHLDESDIFKSLRQIFILKYDVLKKYPGMYDFLVSAINEKSNEIKNEIGNRYEELYKGGMKMLFESFDFSKFKDDADAIKSIKVIRWSLEGLIKDLGYDTTTLYSTTKDQFDKILAEVDSYMELLRKCFYK
ncbi:MAG TPA: TetR/AcrR family transcriptional regulator [Pseudobacteroides sp.]|uniref:TetR/AcrR family transcriptional regulator n=1 Tax=Pseudobacteroides sp. TaxID=1968840 RepID=UPI002F92B090